WLFLRLRFGRLYLGLRFGLGLGLRYRNVRRNGRRRFCLCHLLFDWPGRCEVYEVQYRIVGKLRWLIAYRDETKSACGRKIKHASVQLGWRSLRYYGEVGFGGESRRERTGRGCG